MALLRGFEDRHTSRPRRRWPSPAIASAAVAATVAAATAISGAPDLVAAFSATRTISLYNIHTKETVTVEYKRRGAYVPEAMDRINWILRDWRRDEKTTMDPKTIDILWEMHTELGSKEPIHVISGFRSRTTNDMLRRTVGGQASESQHTTGKAVDVTFPDVPLKNIRYAAMVREQGGVGYYPTSGIPFVHVDTGRVRAWPRLPRYELALLFPNGSTRHAPADGGSLSEEDVKVARSRYKDLAVQIASFFDLRKSGQNSTVQSGIVLADAGKAARPPAVPETRVASLGPAARPAREAGTPSRGTLGPPLTTSLTPQAGSPDDLPADAGPVVAPAARPALKVPTPSPQLVTEPVLVDRPSRLKPRPTETDRQDLNALVAMADTSSAPPRPVTEPAGTPRLLIGPTPARRPTVNAPSDGGDHATALASVLAPGGHPRTSWMQLAAYVDGSPGGPAVQSGSQRVLSDAVPPGWGNGYAAAPAFDEEHPEELHYRPFPIAPLLTATPSIDEPAISQLAAPDVVKIIQLLDQPSLVMPMQFRPGRQTAETMWAQQFQGEAVELADKSRADGAEDLLPTPLIPRGVKTSKQR